MKKILLVIVSLVIGLSLTAYAENKSELKITWFGHAAFLITTPDNTKIILDPVKMEGYEIPKDVIPDIVTVSHNHFDHNQVDGIPGKPIILYGKSEKEEPPYQKYIQINDTISNVIIHTVQSNHFPPDISPELNAIFVFEFDGIRIVHLGDLGMTLNENQIKQIGEIDILMIPVGGKYTVTLPQADSVVNQLKPSMAVFPMHYKTKFADFVPNTADDFVQGKTNVVRIPENEYVFDLKNKPDHMQYVVFDCFK